MSAFLGGKADIFDRKADIELAPITMLIGGSCALKYKTLWGVTGESAEPHLLSLASVMAATFE